jgi:acyl-CoA synthetase (NDP forming)
MTRVLAPRSIAVIGGAPAMRVVEQCIKLGYAGDIWPVHPTKPDMHGVPCFASVDDLPAAPDAAFVAVNRHLTVEAVAALAARGAGGAVCYASGFAENGEVDLQHRLVNASGAMTLLGPNCYGYINALDGVALWPDEHGCRPIAHGVGIVSQSGNVGLNLTLQLRGLPIAYMVTVGNQAGDGTEDVVEAFIADPRVTAIGLYIEAIREPVRFAALARRAHEAGKRIVALQTGRSEAGALIAASHTASLAGNREAYAALFSRCGVAQVDTPAELVETLKVLHGGGPTGGVRLASLSCSGGEASLVADLSERTSLRFEPFPAEQRARIESTLTELVNVANPFDYHTFMWGDRKAMAATFAATMDGPHDATVLILDAPPRDDQDPSTWLVAADALADAAEATGRRAFVVATIPECLNEQARDAIAHRGLVALQGITEAFVALDRAAWLGAHAPQVEPAPVVAQGDTVLVDESTAKGRLREWGIAVPRGVACSHADVVTVAADVGYPVTLKALHIAHKSDMGAVAVGIPDETSLRDRLAAMPSDAREFLVEQTVTGVVTEVLVGIRRAAPVGWLITVGAGGVLTELWRDTACLLAPATRDDVRTALLSLRTAPLITGYRGKAAGNIEAVVDLVMTLQQATVDTKTVEIEINPVLVTVDGAAAVDALLIEEGTTRT